MKKIFIFLFLLSAAIIIPVFVCAGLEVELCNIFKTIEYEYLASGALHLGMFSLAMFLLWKKNFRDMFEQVGFPGSLKANIVYTVGGLLAVFLALILLGMVVTILDINDQTNVIEKVASLPIYILIFAAIAAPFSEELFFRALLVPRIGLLFSSVFFGMVHFTYGSVVEVMGATMIGFILAVIYRMSKSITPCILIHMLYNIIAIAIMRLLL